MEETKKVPTHVSIIMDGNGRWARERGMERTYGHVEGVESIRVVTEMAVSCGIKYLSLFGFSEENWGRPQDEVNAIMRIIAASLDKYYKFMLDNGVRFRVLGNRAELPQALEEAIEKFEAVTAGGDKMEVIIFLSYSGRWDILQAAKKFAKDAAGNPSMIDAMDTSDFSKYMVTSDIPDPDLIIRTSGEQRISNYLLWQGAYSEFYFTGTLWPDFRSEEFRKALDEFSRRDRRYGKVK